jgi:outer membrane protein assembly factor BamB
VAARTTWAAAVAALTLVSLGLSGATAGLVHPWGMFAHDVLHTSRATVSASTTNHVAWSYNLASSVSDNASPVVGADGTIYMPTTKSLFALNPNGTLKWKKWGTSFDDLTALTAPAIGPSGRIYVVRHIPPSEPNWPGSALTALRPADGSVAWSYPIYHTTYGSPTIGPNETIFVAGGRSTSDHSGTLYAIKSDGTLKWSWPPTGPGSSAWIETSPIVKGTDVYVVHNSFGLVKLNSAGVFQWNALAGTCCWNQPTAAPSGAAIYLGTGSKTFAAVNTSGTPLWSIPVLSTMYESATATDGTTAYRGDNGGTFYAFDLATHTIKWKKTVPGTTIQSTPALATGNGLVAYTQEDGRIYVRKTSDGTLQWRFNLGSATTSSPAIGADGTVYAASGAGKLYAFK